MGFLAPPPPCLEGLSIVCNKGGFGVGVDGGSKCEQCWVGKRVVRRVIRFGCNVNNLPCGVNNQFPDGGWCGVRGNPERAWAYISEESHGFLCFSVGDPVVEHFSAASQPLKGHACWGVIGGFCGGEVCLVLDLWSGAPPWLVRIHGHMCGERYIRFHCEHGFEVSMAEGCLDAAWLSVCGGGLHGLLGGAGGSVENAIRNVYAWPGGWIERVSLVFA